MAILAPINDTSSPVSCFTTVVIARCSREWTEQRNYREIHPIGLSWLLEVRGLGHPGHGVASLLILANSHWWTYFPWPYLILFEFSYKFHKNCHLHEGCYLAHLILSHILEPAQLQQHCKHRSDWQRQTPTCLCHLILTALCWKVYLVRIANRRKFSSHLTAIFVNSPMWRNS